MTELHIKNMVCDRCKLVVSDIFHETGIENAIVDLGKVTFSGEIEANRFKLLKNSLENVGFEIIDDRRSNIVESVKRSIIELVRFKLGEIKVNYSVYLEQKLGMDYNYLSNLFSASEGQTVENYIIKQKIELVKELLVYEQQNLSEIAFELGYSSVSHLSNQFKKVTGLTPSHFKEIGNARRNTIDSI